jgi:hypothetical protein
MPTDEADKDVVTRPKRNPYKKTGWGDKSDKLIHGKKTAFKRKLEEIVDEDEDISEYVSR